MTSLAPPRPVIPFTARRLAVALTALALVGGLLMLMVWMLWPDAPKTAPKAPFGLAREAAPMMGGLGSHILALQGAFYKALTDAVSALKEGRGAIWPLIGIGFAYGVFHAAGPGHGKGIISAYLVASGRSLMRGLGICLAAALLQALVAITIVGVAVLALQTTARQMNAWADLLETVSFAVIALVGIGLVWRKAGKFLGALDASRGIVVDPATLACDHVHLPPPEEIDRLHHWRDRLGVIVAAGARPCSGALIILVFSLSQGLFAAGILATLAMALGTAITTGLIATLAVFAKALALRLAGGRSNGFAPLAASALELTAAAFVATLGLSLMLGLWIEQGLA